MADFNLKEHPHRRYNLLNGKWILCSPHRTTRPWQGQVEKRSEEKLPFYDSKCYLCPRNTRAAGDRNPDYDSTFVFKNDFSALIDNSPEGKFDEGGLLRAEGTRGECRVICFSPNHSLTVAEMDTAQIRTIIDEWIIQYAELTAKYKFAQLFENKGAIMGCSNPHPHGQVWACATIPEEVHAEVTQFAQHRAQKNCCLLCDYLAVELKSRERIIFENEGFVALVPFWAYWPFEILILPKQHLSMLSDMITIDNNNNSSGTPAAGMSHQRDQLAEVIKVVNVKYDNLFETSFPFSMGVHQAPVEEGVDHSGFHFHLHYYPPLLRSATVKKFLVGYEMVADLCRDIPAELSAQRLREMSDVHYKIRDQSSQ